MPKVINDEINEMELSELTISPTVPFPAAPPWVLKEMTTDFGLLEETTKERHI